MRLVDDKPLKPAYNPRAVQRYEEWIIYREDTMEEVESWNTEWKARHWRPIASSDERIS